MKVELTEADWKYILKRCKILSKIYSKKDRGCVSHEDLYQEAVLKVLETAKNYNPDKKVKITTYLDKRISGAMIDFLRKLKLIDRKGRLPIPKFITLNENLFYEKPLGRVLTKKNIC